MWHSILEGAGVVVVVEFIDGIELGCLLGFSEVAEVELAKSVLYEGVYGVVELLLAQ